MKVAHEYDWLELNAWLILEKRRKEAGTTHTELGMGMNWKRRSKKLKSHFANKIVGVKIKLSELHSAETQK